MLDAPRIAASTDAGFRTGPRLSALRASRQSRPSAGEACGAYIRDNIGATLRASELSELVRLSCSHFSRAFKVSFHQTFMSYIMRQRVSLARHKMLTTDHALCRIAWNAACATRHISAERFHASLD